MKYYRVFADYRIQEKHPCYDYVVDDDTKSKEIKKWFENCYTWLKVYEVKEIQKSEVDKWALKLIKKTFKEENI